MNKFIALTTSLWLLTSSADAAIPKYDCKPLQYFKTQKYTLGFGMNSSGDVAGVNAYHDGYNDQAMKWQGTTAKGLGFAEYVSFARAINDRGEVVGTYEDMTSSYGVMLPTIWRETGFSYLPILDASGGHARAINNRSEVAGYLYTSYPNGGLAQHGAFWANGQLTTFTEDWSVALGINDASVVVGKIGSQAAKWNIFPPGYATTVLQNLPGTASSQANAVNDAEIIVGSSGSLPVAWFGNHIAALGLPSGMTKGDARAINSAGAIVGVASEDAISSDKAVIWESKDKPAVVLDTRIASGCEGQFANGFQIISAEAINGSGIVLVNARKIRPNKPPLSLAFRLTPR